VERLFTPAERWLGGLFGVWIELGERSGEDSPSAVDALWAHPALDGPYPHRELEPWAQSRADPRQFPEQEMCGVATLHDGARVPCKAHLFRGPPEDSITLDVPLNGLYAAWPHAIAEDPDDTAGARLWQEPLVEWFADIARHVFDQVRFRAATIGYEVDPLEEADLQEWLRGEVPARRWLGVLIRRGDGLVWYPPTVWEPIDFRDDVPPESASSRQPGPWTARVQALARRLGARNAPPRG
jgi:hypothetical protein